MTVTEVLNEKPMPLAEVKQELERIQKRDEELTFRGNKTLEYVQQVKPLGPKKAKEAMKKVAELEIPRLKEVHVAKLVDILPRSADEVKMVLQGYVLTIKDEHAKKIAEVLQEY